MWQALDGRRTSVSQRFVHSAGKVAGAPSGFPTLATSRLRLTRFAPLFSSATELVRVQPKSRRRSSWMYNIMLMFRMFLDFDLTTAPFHSPASLLSVFLFNRVDPQNERTVNIGV